MALGMMTVPVVRDLPMREWLEKSPIEKGDQPAAEELGRTHSEIQLRGSSIGSSLASRIVRLWSGPLSVSRWREDFSAVSDGSLRARD